MLRKFFFIIMEMKIYFDLPPSYVVLFVGIIYVGTVFASYNIFLDINFKFHFILRTWNIRSQMDLWLVQK